MALGLRQRKDSTRERERLSRVEEKNFHCLDEVAGNASDKRKAELKADGAVGRKRHELASKDTPNPVRYHCIGAAGYVSKCQA